MRGPAPELLSAQCAWPRAKLGEAFAVVDRLLFGADTTRPVANPASDVSSGAPLERWVQAAARRLELDVETPDDRAPSLADVLPEQSVLVARWSFANGEQPEDAYLLVQGPVLPHHQTATVLSPRGQRVVSVLDLEEALLRGQTADLNKRLSLPAAQALAASRALRAALGGGLKGEGWILEQTPTSFWPRAWQLGAGGWLVRGALAFAAQVALFAGAWALVGKGALEGRLETGTLLAFALLLVSMVVVRAWASQQLGRAVVLLSGLARERLLEGILRLDTAEVRHRGVGQLLGTVLEVDSLEVLARAGGPAVVWVALDTALAICLLLLGAGGAMHGVLIVAWLAVFAVWVLALVRRLVVWTQARLQITHDLVEAMVGHRTLVAQDAGRHIEHLRDDLDAYQKHAARLDADTARVTAVVPRGVVVLGLIGLAPAFIDRATPPGALATSLAGVLLLWSAFRRLADSTPALGSAFAAWRNLKFLFASAARRGFSSADVLAASPDEAAVGKRGLLVARDVMFGYAGRPEPVLKGCSFAIERHDRVLLEGDSGGGKSTLGSILAGLRTPTSGVLLLGGFDHHAVGPDRWRQRAGGVPQFHENHMFANSLLFNLLMGRRWPPRMEDVQAAQSVCEELGLGPLLARMPAGLNQTVGDSGWQLSHGERSRVYVARSLLQRVDLRVLDESLAALDPATSLRVIEALLSRPEALVLIAHR